MKKNSEKDERWKEQYERIKRWYEKTREIDFTDEIRKKQHKDDRHALLDLLIHQKSITDEGLDIYYTFFINCFHLKDWLMRSKALPNDVIDEFFHNNEQMKVCHIICTGSKHLDINDKRILDIQKDRYGPRVEYDPTRPNSDTDGYVKTRLIHINSKTYDLMDLAKKCIHEIDNFLYFNNLLKLDHWKRF